MKTIVTSILLLATSVTLAQEKKATPNEIKEIKSVIIKRKNITKKSDRLVFNVGNSPIAKGLSTFDMLKQTPLLSSTDDENIQISGKSNVVYFINGKRSRMNASAIEAFLKNTPAENIKKIEVITLPGSEYNVESSEGVVNIIMKTNRGNGINGNLRLVNSQAKDNGQKIATSINFRKDKWSGNAQISFSNRPYRQEFTLRNGTLQSSNESVGEIFIRERSLGGYLNLDYEINKKNNIGLSYNIWNEKLTNGGSDLFNTVRFQNTTTYNRTINEMKNESYNHSVNLNYQWKPNKTTKININTAYLNYDKDELSENTTNRVNSENQFISLLGKFKQKNPQTVNNFSTDAHLVKKFKALTLGIGGNFNYTKTDNETYIENFINDNYIKNENQSNQFEYNEKISGIYMNIEKSFSKKFSAKIGTRIEFTNSVGNVKNTDIKINRNKTNILPTLNLNYNISSKHMLSYGFSSRVKRPSFWEINPVRIYLTEVNYAQNNPFLKSEKIYNQEAMYLYKGKYFFQVQHTTVENASDQIPLQRTLSNGSTELRYIRTNYGTVNQINLNIGMNNSFFKGIWNVNYVIGLQNNKYKGKIDTDPITEEKFTPYVADGQLTSLFASANNNIRLSSQKDWYMGVNFFYLSKARINLGTLEPLMALDLSVKKLWKNWTFALDVKDIFKTRKNTISSVQENGDFNYINQYQNTRKAILSVTYNFGNKKVKRMRKIKTATESIKNRTGK